VSPPIRHLIVLQTVSIQNGKTLRFKNEKAGGKIRPRMGESTSGRMLNKIKAHSEKLIKIELIRIKWLASVSE
jgi:hypothetical protein